MCVVNKNEIANFWNLWFYWAMVIFGLFFLRCQLKIMEIKKIFKITLFHAQQP